MWMQLLVVDPDKRVIMANKHFLSTQGYSEGDVLGKLYHMISPWHSEDPENNLPDQVLRSRNPIKVEEKSSDGERYTWHERYLAPILDEKGDVEFVIEAVRDITDQKLLEQEKMERMKLQGVIEMAGTAAHELNSPLFAALGTAQLLRDDLPAEDMIEEMDMIIRNMKTMSELTRKMTSVTGFESKDYVGETKIVTLKTKE